MFRSTLLTIFVLAASLAKAEAQQSTPVFKNTARAHIAAANAEDDDRELTDAEYLTVLLKSLRVDLPAAAREFEDEMLSEQLNKMGAAAKPVLEDAVLNQPKVKAVAQKLLEDKIDLTQVKVFTCHGSGDAKKKKNSDWGSYDMILSPTKEKDKFTLHVLTLEAPIPDAETTPGTQTEFAIAISGMAQLKTVKKGHHPKPTGWIEISLTSADLKLHDTVVVGRTSKTTRLIESTRSTMCKLPALK